MQKPSSSALKHYEERLDELRQAARLSGLTQADINDTIRESLLYIRNRPSRKNATKDINEQRDKSTEKTRKRKKILAFFALSVLFAFYYCDFLYKPVHNLFERNIQDSIYPFMKFYRRITLPIIALFPAITSLYDESCLVENPYFHVADMECWPCQTARVVLNLTENISNAHVGLPFITKTSQPETSLSAIRNEYLIHKQVIDKNKNFITSNVGWTTISDLLREPSLQNPEIHGVWRINRMEVGRAMRSVLRPPESHHTPDHASFMGIERFLLVDGPNALFYALPATEGANVFIRQLSGQRLIILEPAPECLGSCRRLSVLLEPSHILWYNWWYWRARSHPALNASSGSVAFVGSTS